MHVCVFFDEPGKEFNNAMEETLQPYSVCAHVHKLIGSISCPLK